MGKKHISAIQKIDRMNKYTLEKAIEVVKQLAYAKFDETVDLAINLGIDPKKSDQTVRGSMVLPYSLGRKVRVVAFAKGEKVKEAQEAGADDVGAEELVERISGGWLDFDKVVATPDVMGIVSKLGKVLGPRGLMPNPKTGTVTFDIGKAIKEAKAGKVDFKTEKSNIVHISIGKVSFDTQKLIENARVVLEAILKAKPPTSKGTYLRKLSVSSTMGIGIPVDVSTAMAAAGR